MGLRESFRRDGYVVLNDVIAPAAIDAALAEVRAVFDGLAVPRGLPPTRGPGLPALTGTMTALFRADMAAYLAAARLCQHMPALHRMGVDDRLLEAVRALGLALPSISTRPVLFIIAEALAVPGGYHRTPPHQDWRSIQGSLDGVVAWAPFADVAADADALEVQPGSHRLGLLPSAEHPFGHQVAPEAVPDLPWVPLAVKRGAAVLFSTLLVHRTGRPGAGVARLAASFRFNNVAEPSYAERLYPNPYIYRPDYAVLHPDAAAANKVAAVFDAGEVARPAFA